MGYESLAAFVKDMEGNLNNASVALKDAFGSAAVFGMGGEIKTQMEAFNEQLLQLGSTTGLTISQTKALA
jgi:hypothetical protein